MERMARKTIRVPDTLLEKFLYIMEAGGCKSFNELANMAIEDMRKQYSGDERFVAYFQK